MPLAPVAAVLVADRLPRTYVDEVALLLPAGITGLLVTSVLSPLLVGGGFELVPEAQLVSFPLRARTRVDVSLLLAPLNLAWLLQALQPGRHDGVRRGRTPGPLGPGAAGPAARRGPGGHRVSGPPGPCSAGPGHRPGARSPAAVTAAVVLAVVWRLRDLALVDVAAALGADKVAAVVAAAARDPATAAGLAVLLVAVALAGRELAVASCSLGAASTRGAAGRGPTTGPSDVADSPAPASRRTCGPWTGPRRGGRSPSAAASS